MGHKIDRTKYIGNKYNRWTILSIVSDSPKINGVKYLCVCKCGKHKEVFHCNIVYGKSKSCGCHQKEVTQELNPKLFRKASGHSTAWNLFGCYKKRARKIKKEFSLDFDDFLVITKQNCSYCGRVPENKHHVSSKNKTWREENCYIYNGIDRIDSDLGYTKDNVVPCCKFCNWAKMDQTQEHFINHVEAMYKYLFKK